jgi:hypothetical protein
MNSPASRIKPVTIGLETLPQPQLWPSSRALIKTNLGGIQLSKINVLAI